MKKRTRIRKNYIYDGGGLNELHPNKLWVTLVGDDKKTTTTQRLAAEVGYLFRALRLLSNGVASMPYAIKNKSSDKEVLIFDGVTMQGETPDGLGFLENLSDILWRAELSQNSFGYAYFEKIYSLSGNNLLDLRFIPPGVIKPQIEDGELTGFITRDKKNTFDVEDIFYVWYPDVVGTGEPEAYPLRAAVQSAGVLQALDDFLTRYMNSGAVRQTLLTFDKDVFIQEEEKKRILAWWNRFIAGVKSAFSSEIISDAIKPVVIGDGISELSDENLTKAERENILTALGIPVSKMVPAAANFAVRRSDELAFIEDTLIPNANRVFTALNRQILDEKGYQIVAKANMLRVVQKEEYERMLQFGVLIRAGLTHSQAATIIGIELPERLPGELSETEKQRIALIETSKPAKSISYKIHTTTEQTTDLVREAIASKDFSILAVHYTDVFLEARGLEYDELNNEERLELQSFLREQEQAFEEMLAEYEELTEEEQKRRIVLWATVALMLQNKATARREPEALFAWRMGPTEHCTDCLANSQMVKTAAEWQAWGLPQNPNLECTGINCQCWLEKVD